MFDIANKILGQFNVSEIPTLPELLLKELDELQEHAIAPIREKKPDALLQALVSDDMFLFARLLAGSPVRTGNRNLYPAEIISHAGMENASAIIRQNAARMSFERLPSSRIRFLKQLYLQSFLSRALAENLSSHIFPESAGKPSMVEQAGFCGQFLNIGALAMEQVYPSRYLDLLQQAGNINDLLEVEVREFGIDHAELGAALLKYWHAEGFCQDAVRYHHHDISEILDATPLVKIAWLANQLADEKDSHEAPVWADTLFGLQEQTLIKISEDAQSRLGQMTKALGLRFSSTRYLPLPTTVGQEVLKQEKRAIRQLRYRVEAENLFATVREELENSESPAQLGKALGFAVRLLFGPYEGLLFKLSKDFQYLEFLTGSISEGSLTQLRIRNDAERSVLADSCLGKEPVLLLPGQGLTVIDRQLLSLLDADNFCCEPITSPIDNKICGVLILGIPIHQADSYKKQVYLRRALIRELGIIMAGKTVADTSEVDVLTAKYERSIRETIHEVNNPLGIIKNYLQLLSMKQGDDSKTRSEISFIKSEIDRIGNILDKLRDLPASSDSDDSNGSLNINVVVTSLVNMITGSMDSSNNITIETDLMRGLQDIPGSENAVRQIITNLVKNSAEACKDGGSILVKTAGNVYMNGNRYIQLTVKDNGPGIESDILDNLFAPGNSSKGSGHSGSGLSIAKSLVEKLDGQISCQTTHSDQLENNRASGTEFTVLLPANRMTDVEDTH